jgi:hypothetical protein
MIQGIIFARIFAGPVSYPLRKMPQIDEAKVNEAVRECLGRCEQSKNIIPEVAKYLDSLEMSGGWSDDELHEVELAVIRMLFCILDCAVYPGEATSPQRPAVPSLSG